MSTHRDAVILVLLGLVACGGGTTTEPATLDASAGDATSDASPATAAPVVDASRVSDRTCSSTFDCLPGEQCTRLGQVDPRYREPRCVRGASACDVVNCGDLICVVLTSSPTQVACERL